MPEKPSANTVMRASQPRWLRLYSVLAIVSVATLGATLYLAARVMTLYSESMRVSAQWDARHDRFAELSALTFAVDAPANEVFNTNDGARGLASLERAEPPLDAARRALRAEFENVVRGAVSRPILRALDDIDSSTRRMAAEARMVFSELRAGRRDSAAARMAAMDREFARTDSIIRRAQFSLTTVRQREFRERMAHASVLRSAALIVAIAAVILIGALAFYGMRLARAATRNAEEQAHQLDALRQSQERYRVLNEALTEAQGLAHAARETAEAANRSKSDFLANMSHELRTPMHGVLGMLELAMSTELSAAQRDYLGTAHGSAQWLLGLINDILDFSDIEAGRLKLDPTDFHLGNTLRDVAGPLVARGEDKGLEVSVEVAADVPAAVHGDAGRLRQVLVNLIGNAIKFTERGSVALRVSVEELSESALVLHFAVQDSGIGIPAEKQRVVFDAFRQADDSTTREFGGTGLGLAICAAVVGIMGGKIWVESAPGRGSTFHFTTTLSPAHGPVPTTSQPTAQQDRTPAPAGVAPPGLRLPAPPAHATLRALVVDDNAVNQKVACNLLEREGHSAAVAANGQEAVELVSQADFDIVLMDIQMPVLGGIEATRMIRDWERRVGGHVPIIAVTARTVDGDREACLAAGMDGFLPKPVRSEALFAMIDTLVRRKTAPRATSAPAVHASDEILDEPELLASVQGDRALASELEALFVGDVPRQVAAMRGAMERSDARALQFAAHALKGSAATLTARAVAARARALEAVAASGDLRDARRALADLEDALRHLCDRLTTDPEAR